VKVLKILLLLFLFATNAHAWFLVEVGRSATSAPDTVRISWQKLEWEIPAVADCHAG
jgi:hypothetical protein